MVALGVKDDDPPNDLQPRLQNGIHLRWMPRPETGLPRHGYYLFRREHIEPTDIDKVCAEGSALTNFLPGFESDKEIQIENFPAGVVGIDLEDREYLHFIALAGKHRVEEIKIGFKNILPSASSKIEIIYYSGSTPVKVHSINGSAGAIHEISFDNFEYYTSVKISKGPAILLSICAEFFGEFLRFGWEKVPKFLYPLCLPVAHDDYPCKTKPSTFSEAEDMAIETRVSYGDPEIWRGDPFKQLHEALSALVEKPKLPQILHRMHLRSVKATGVSEEQSADIDPTLKYYPLYLILLASSYRAIAEMLGLIYTDTQVDETKSYDYLLLADNSNEFNGDADNALKWVKNDPEFYNPNFTRVNSSLVFNRKMKRTEPLSAPTDVRVYALPGSVTSRKKDSLVDLTNNSGLRWNSERPSLNQSSSLIEYPQLYHIWRADLGMSEPDEEHEDDMPLPDQYKLLTENAPTMLMEQESPAATTPTTIKSPSNEQTYFENNWPPFSLYYIDRSLSEGWYSYFVTAIDLFGRHSLNSQPAQWYQWRISKPELRPWYYKGPAMDKIVHPFAVGLLDKSPPPPPIARAYALDPVDPYITKDGKYNAWWNSLTSSSWYNNLSEEQKRNLVALRIELIWKYYPHMQQAPDVKEFRVYYQPDHLNMLLGNSTTVTVLNDNECQVETDIITGTDNYDKFAGTSLRIGQHVFTVTGSDSINNRLRLQVQNIKHDKVDEEESSKDEIIKPSPHHPCSVVIPAKTVESADHHPLFTDYANSNNWNSRFYVIDYDDEHLTTRFDTVSDASRKKLTGQGATIFEKEVHLDETFDLSNLTKYVNDIFMVFYTGNDPMSINSQDLYRITNIDNETKTVTLEQDPAVVVNNNATNWSIGWPYREYILFLPQAGDDDDDNSSNDHSGLPLLTSLEEPIVYAHLGVSAADDKMHTLDSPKWNSGEWGNRPGNEGSVGPPSTIYRVRRERPQAPLLPPDSERVFASPADYYSNSYYTFRWLPVEGLKTHIYRSLDDVIFQIDWRLRPRPDLSPTDADLFPSNDPRWDEVKRDQVCQQLNILNNFPKNDEGKNQAMIYYDQLSNDSLRILAGLAGNEKAFTQITMKPLDPQEPNQGDFTKLRWQDIIGPDTESSYKPRTDLRAYVDTVNGRSRNRYFYRYVYVDKANNISKLSISSPPVWIPEIFPPSRPLILRVLGGDKSVTIYWKKGDNNTILDRCLVYRTENKENARDIRLMDLVANISAQALSVVNGSIDLGIETDVSRVERVYDASNFDPSLDLLAGQNAVNHLGSSTVPENNVIVNIPAPNDTPVVVVYTDSKGGIQYTTPPGTFPSRHIDNNLIGLRYYYYRIVVTNKGITKIGLVSNYSSPSSIGSGRALALVGPDPPTILSIKWVRIDGSNQIHEFDEVVPSNEKWFSAVHIGWTSQDPSLSCLVQYRIANQGDYESVSGWLPRGSYNYIHKNYYTYLLLEYRIKVQDNSGNVNRSYLPVELTPVHNGG